MSTIAKINAREVLDSRGNPTVEVDVICSDGARGRAIVPSGASTGTAEAHELRDGDSQRYDGRGVYQAVANVHRVIPPAVIGLDPLDQLALDRRLLELDDSPQKTKLGANALLGVSLAVAHAAAASAQKPLYLHFHRLFQQSTAESDSVAPPKMPLPMTNMISGGLHAGGNLDFQDVLISPKGAASYAIGLEWTVRVYRRLGQLLARAGYESHLVGDEGGYGPRLKSNSEAIELVVRAIRSTGLRPGQDVTIALDIAATHFYEDGSYRLASEGNQWLTSDEMIDHLVALVDQFPIDSIEDGLAEEDWSAWPRLVKRLGGRVRVVGDDLLTTNVRRVQRAIDHAAANSLLVKVNQIGTLTEAMQTMHLARDAGMSLVVSARSGETEDTTIADLAVGVAAEQIKIGSIVRSERLAKYNRLLRIEEELAAH